jgi:hypothetical protein
VHRNNGFTRSRWQVLNIIYQAGTAVRDVRLRVITGADGILKMSGMLSEELEVSKSEPISPCTTRSTKGYEIEFRVLLTDGTQEVRFKRVAVSST